MRLLRQLRLELAQAADQLLLADQVLDAVAAPAGLDGGNEDFDGRLALRALQLVGFAGFDDDYINLRLKWRRPCASVLPAHHLAGVFQDVEQGRCEFADGINGGIEHG
ncbi:hypothetical protein [Achromobacter xylosoxidans]|uniref:hypothetical protein n=1 Tax=Alcaligenes xylosoxydans xylosoxydans TaxID=85698 RepID=UPI000AF278D7|nr:hypothetical protein [Achromobacter xylosoxidans]QKI79127.1 hypothetical protein HPS43_29040 [Achromobacter xylosoxidans]